MFRTLIGSLLLIILYLATNHRFTFYKHKKSFAFLALSGIACALMSAVMYACMVSFNKKADQIVGMENATLQLTIAFLSASVYVLIRLVGALCIIAGAVGAELKQTQNPMPSSHQGKHRVFHYLLHLLWLSPLFYLPKNFRKNITTCVQTPIFAEVSVAMRACVVSTSR